MKRRRSTLPTSLRATHDGRNPHFGAQDVTRHSDADESLRIDTQFDRLRNEEVDESASHRHFRAIRDVPDARVPIWLARNLLRRSVERRAEGHTTA
jgi:hypothetical protein